MHRSGGRHAATENSNQNIFDTAARDLGGGGGGGGSRSGCDGLMRDNGSGADTVAFPRCHSRPLR